MLKAVQYDDPASGAPAISPTDVGQGNAGPDGCLKDGFTFLNLNLFAVRQIPNYGHIKGGMKYQVLFLVPIFLGPRAVGA
jgi:hypothetical protein